MVTLCCPTNAPSLKVTVQQGEGGCIPSVPRDLVGDGPIVKVLVYKMSADQTTVSGLDMNNQAFDVNTEGAMVFYNGVMLCQAQDDYDLTETSLTLTQPAYDDSDLVMIVSFRESAEEVLSRIEQRLAALENAHAK